MKLPFGKNIPQLSLSDNDKKGVEYIFRRLIYNYGIKFLRGRKAILISEEFFPFSYAKKVIDINATLHDITVLLELKEVNIDIQVFKDTISQVWTDYSPVGSFKESNSLLGWFQADGFKKYQIQMGQSFVAKTELLVSNLVLQCCRIKMIEDGLNIESLSNAVLYQYLSTIFFGLGVITANTSFVDDYFEGGRFQIKSPIELPILGYALGLYTYLQKNSKPAWKKDLNSNCSYDFNASCYYLFKKNDTILTDDLIDSMLKKKELYLKARNEYKTGNFNKAMDICNQLIAMEPDNNIYYNNRGYYQLRFGHYVEAIKDFEECIKINPKSSFGYNNRGYARLMLGELQKGLSDIITSIQYDPQNSYSYRNLGIYYTLIKEFSLAQDNFLKALSMNKDIELFHYYYGLLKIAEGNNEEAIKEFKLSAEKGEIESLQKIKELCN